ncbi:helix-turn-helix transcriptional regulator [Curtobacterium sp. MCPF17_050]|uniref:helix-turn-helix transcriptional regulator n=1 Tax=Curtobacterium sp. MCPF17_050 TaxID=2175664 RepID=UPI000D979239|nr:helix-turn-helix transcriptional regulator [Curtobacterium sp. MCPF17_050]WIB15909.1 helix-turn-helix transcriptional regulator [Curtobacterium sp. MCPF17_050]
MDRTAFGQFLRVHREALLPSDVGLTSGPRRRAPGLRREEVAQLACVTVDYYARLEQGRGAQPSAQMLSVLARVLRLTLDERDHLYRVAGQNPPDRASGSSHVSPALLRVMDKLADTPAFVLSDLAETLASNPLADALLGAPHGHSGPSRSGIYRWFAAADAERALYLPEDREHQGRALVAGLRMALGRRGPQSTAAELVRRLARLSPEFVAIWELQEVATRYQDRKTIVHPEVGAIEFDCLALFTEDQSQTLIVLTVPARTPAADRLDFLRAIGPTQFGSPSTAGADSSP